MRTGHCLGGTRSYKLWPREEAPELKEMLKHPYMGFDAGLAKESRLRKVNTPRYGMRSWMETMEVNEDITRVG